MSFCPTRDIHSIYLDNEMPEVYKAEYEAHLKECEKCRKELAKIKALHSILNDELQEELKDIISEDSVKASNDENAAPSTNLFTEEFMNKSFERLQMKMKYAENVKQAAPQKNFNFRQFVPTVAAAAAVCTAIVLPLELSSNKNNSASNQTTAFLPQIQTSSNVSLNTLNNKGRSVVVSGNIHQSIVSSYAANSVLSAGSYNGLSTNNDAILATEVSNGTKANNIINHDDMINKIDVFRPAFEENDSKSIKITVPDMNNMPVQIEISFPDSEK